MVYRWLNFHLPYRCRHSGACCKSGWPIPVEDAHARAITDAIRGHKVLPLVTPWLTDAKTLATTDTGQCAFHYDRCGVYEARPESCRHFPYVCLIDQRGVSVSLSHYCPTAASLLFEHEGPIEIVEGPAPIAGMEIPEGLDARESLPPRATATRLMSFEEFSLWEANRIEMLYPENWGGFGPVVRRYLAAKLFASWAAYQGDGTGAVLAHVDRAEKTLRDNIAGRAIDAETLKEAIRQTDLLLVHSVSA